VSKRSYRRLAVVAGAALAVGSMTPALAAQVSVSGDGDASVDVSGLTIPSTETLIPEALIADAQTFALDTVFGAKDLAEATVEGLQSKVETDVESIVEKLFSATSSLSLTVQAGANANAGSGGATVSVSGVAVGGADVLGLVPDPGTALTGVQDHLTPLVEFGTSTVDGALLLADEAKAAVVGTGTGLLGTGLDGASLSLNAIAALMATL
jgi:hypothetical protein